MIVAAMGPSASRTYSAPSFVVMCSNTTFKAGNARRKGFMTRSTKMASRSNTSIAGSVTSPCTSSGIPHFSKASSALVHLPSKSVTPASELVVAPAG
ncbi:hypothetical protein D3C72_1670070 [compost metagenome]